jgi:uncharacterized protein (UPF0264 family)
MTDDVRLLVSVRCADEAAVALDSGADVIDVKEPSRGALGKADDITIAAIVDRVQRRAAVSVAMGELADAPPVPPTGVDYIKFGLAHAPADWRKRLTGGNVIVVAYADHRRAGSPPVADVIAFAVRHRVKGVLIDTAVKDGRDLFDFSDDDLPRWIEMVQQAGRIIALAGSLHGDAIDRAAALRPDIIGVRGAACRKGDRAAAIDADRIARLKARLSKCTTPAAAPAG